MESTQQVVYDIQLPSFALSFKDACLTFLVPNLQHLLAFMESSDSKNSYVFILTILLFALVLKSIFCSIFLSPKITNNAKKDFQIKSECQQMKGEIRNIRNVIKKIADSGFIQNDEQMNPSHRESIMANLASARKLMQTYQSAIQSNQNISEYIINSHRQLLKELKKLKKMKQSFDMSPRNSNLSDRSLEPVAEKVVQLNPSEASFQQQNSENEIILPKSIKKVLPTKATAKRNVPPPPVRKS